LSVPPPVGAAARVGRVVGNKLLLKRLVGSGGMGEVYEAEHLTLGATVAVKVLLPELAANPVYVERFRREARSALLLDHANVVRILDFDQYEDLFCIVMEYLRGPSLSSWAMGTGPRALPDLVLVFDQVLAAVEAAHAHGIVHRDLKPENVLIADPGVLSVKVVDFGLAHLADLDRNTRLTVAHTVVGTPEYMSPEQCRSFPVGPPTDVYALGCLLTALLQGRPPFQGPSGVDVMYKHLQAPTPPLQLPPGAPPFPDALEQLRLDMLLKDPAGRPSAAEARRRLAETLGAAARPASSSAPAAPEPLSRPHAPAPNAPTLIETARTDAFTPDVVAALTPLQVTVVRLSSSDGGVNADRVADLALCGLRVATVEAAGSFGQPPPDLIVIDAGSEIVDAAVWLGRAATLNPAPPVLVCVDGLRADQIKDLVVAGAADAVAYPIAFEQLRDRIARLVSRATA
jgi:serine/threonine-protein kinase